MALGGALAGQLVPMADVRPDTAEKEVMMAAEHMASVAETRKAQLADSNAAQVKVEVAQWPTAEVIDYIEKYMAKRQKVQLLPVVLEHTCRCVF